MPFIEIEVDDGVNSDMSLSRVFETREEPYPISSVEALRPDGSDGLCDVVGWSTAGPCLAYAVRVSDSGDGVAILVYGGEHGVRLRASGSNGPWDLSDSNQWGEPCLLLPVF